MRKLQEKRPMKMSIYQFELRGWCLINTSQCKISCYRVTFRAYNEKICKELPCIDDLILPLHSSRWAIRHT
jgi:hypothetical protein